jgi:ParB/RepB/Spo0J family partition protein
MTTKSAEQKKQPTLAELVSGKSDAVAAAVKEHAAKKSPELAKLPGGKEPVFGVSLKDLKKEEQAQKKLLEAELPSIIETKEIALEKLDESPANPRKQWGDLEELTKNVEALGVLQALTVRPTKGGRYEIVFGHRRFRAAKRAKLEKVRCDVRELTDAQVAEAQAAENLERQDLNPLEEASAYENMRKAGFEVKTISARLGKSPEWVYARLKLLALCAEAKKLVLDGKLDASVGVPLARLPAKQQAEALSSPEWARQYTTRDQVKWLQSFCPNLKNAPFNVKDAELVKAAGACTSCPFNSNNQPADLFSDFGKLTGPGICTKASCYEAKVQAGFEVKAKAAQAKGQEVLQGESADAQLLSGKLVALTESCWNHPKKASFRELLEALPEKLRPATALAQDTRRGGGGEAIQVVDREELLKAHRERGAAWAGAKLDEHSKAEKGRKAKLKEQRELAIAAVRAIWEKLRGSSPTASEVRLLIGAIWAEHYSRHLPVEDLLGLSHQEINGKLKAWNTDQLLAFGLALAMTRWIPDYEPSIPAPLKELAEGRKVDLKELAKELKGGAK